MKNDNISTALNLVLAVLAILGVIFALQTIFRTRELRSLQMQATQANGYRMAVESLANDAVVYSKQIRTRTSFASCSPPKPNPPTANCHERI
jgi:beta-lactamase regulating signal transducer with metallopeptidase domain